MDKLLDQLRKHLPGVVFVSGDSFRWSPGDKTVTYRAASEETDIWALLHESSHALLGHADYQFDVDLLLLETEAWEKAKGLAEEFGINIDNNHIQDCLDTYRDWLHQRSTCPRCSTVSFQVSPRNYACHNCSAIWRVSSSRFCRPYRLNSGKQKERSLKPIAQATFR